MPSIKIIMRDGTAKYFPHTGRSGGSFTKTVRYEPGFVVVVDEYYRETAIPTDLVQQVETWPER